MSADLQLRDELAHRLDHVQALMQRKKLDMCFVSNATNFRYLTGVVSDFFISPTRPWFLLVPATGLPIAIVPDIGRGLLANTPLQDIRTWPSPRPDDEGVTLLLEVMNELGESPSVVGAELGHESRLGMPVDDFDRLRRNLPPEWGVHDCSGLFHEARMVKSAYEVERIANACSAASQAFSAIASFIRAGVLETEVARTFIATGFVHGANGCPYLSLVRGRGGYSVPVIRAAREQPIDAGDVLSIDVGFTVDGYFCDFNRNWLVGSSDLGASEAYRILHHVTDVGIDAVRPGMPLASVWEAMASELQRHGTVMGGERLGHGVGLDLTEPPSISGTDTTEIRPGMVLCIEPGYIYGDGRLMLHEEIVAVGERGSRILTARAASELLVVG